MSSEAMGGSAEAERLSALVDGELDGPATGAACKGWKNDAQVRCTWHAYQLIGDVLRSDDLATGAGRDEKFLLRLRTRLEIEPVVLAPAALPATPSAQQRAPTPASRAAGRWMLPSAIAAGFLLVLGAFTVLRPGNAPPATAPMVAVADATSPAGVAGPLRTVSLGGPAEPMEVVLNGKVIRDARLDRYLAAHKQFSGSSALGLPSAFLRSATVESDAR
jgi:sigma-E factor negative regulatory protein RseA